MTNRDRDELRAILFMGVLSTLLALFVSLVARAGSEQQQNSEARTPVEHAAGAATGDCAERVTAELDYRQLTDLPRPKVRQVAWSA